jgi:hypothetical protein
MLNLDMQSDDPICAFEEPFQRVNPRLGFNFDLKSDGNLVYQEKESLVTSSSPSLGHILLTMVHYYASVFCGVPTHSICNLETL